jgi:hypothetical protein
MEMETELLGKPQSQSTGISIMYRETHKKLLIFGHF